MAMFIFRIMGEQTNLFGIPVPSTNRIFLAFVVVHILIALVSVISGIFAMFSIKGSAKHSRYGKIYFWSMLSAFVTISILSVMRWPHNNHLLLIGFFSITFTLTGYCLSKVKPKNWTRLHTICMGLSYIFLLTGFYVDNGKNLPFWNQFPRYVFYVLPSIIGIPIVVYVVLKHPLNKQPS
jgi:hypothetical protein